MSDHVIFSASKLGIFEDEVFANFLAPVLKEVRKWNVPCVNFDSAAIRARTGFGRNMGDIDLLFPMGGVSEIRTLVESLEAQRLGQLIVANEDGFFRLKYNAQTVDPLVSPSNFLVDFHVGAIFQYNKALPFESRLTPDNPTWDVLQSVSGNQSIHIPLPNIHSLFRLKCSRFLGHDAIDILTLFMDARFRNEFPEFKVPEVQKALHNIADNFPLVATQFSTFYFKTHNAERLEEIADALRTHCGKRPNSKALAAYNPNISTQLADAGMNILSLLSQENQRKSAIAAALSAAKLAESIDGIACQQFKTAAVLLDTDARGQPGKNALRGAIAAIDELIERWSQTDDKLEIGFSDLREYYKIILYCEEGNGEAIDALFKSRKSHWKGPGASPIEILSYMACAINCIDRNVRFKTAGEWSPALIDSILSDLSVEIQPLHVGNRTISDVLETSAECLHDVKTSIQILREGPWTRKKCLDQLALIRQNSGTFLCVSRVLEALIERTS